MRTRIPLGTGALICGALVVLLYYLSKKLQGGITTVDPWGASSHNSFKAERYEGFSLADDEFADMDPQSARIVFYIMISGWKELAGLDAIFDTLYHTDHLFLLHMDVQAHENARNQVERRISQVLMQHGNGRTNIRLVHPSMPVTWGGFTMTLSAVYGLAQALHWTSKWDYFINLSASDLPLITADEMSHILGEHKAHNTSFIKGFLYQPSWEGFTFVDRREMFSEDVSLMSIDEREKKWPWAILDKDKNMLMRPQPELFTVYKGEFWVTLHRNMALYIHKSPDNMARMLLGYFSGMMVSDEEFFQTVACNPHFPGDKLKTHGDNLRFVNWWGGGASPSAITPARAVAAANSGAMFGRKFVSMTEEGRDGIKWIQDYLANPARSKFRVERVKRRLAERMGPGGEPQSFCGKKQERHPPEAYFATEGEEEKLPGAK